MGFLDKVKDFFKEEEEYIEPVKKEVMHVEIKAPAKPEVKEEVIVQKEVAVEQKPLFFDDKDFINDEQKVFAPKPKPAAVKPVVRPEPTTKTSRALYQQADKKPVRNEVYGNAKKANDRKQFKVSPIISPVYGVLDQNYKAENIIKKTEPDINSIIFSTNKGNTNDEVKTRSRNTLEDEINSNLTSIDNLVEDKKIVEKKPEVELQNDILDDMVIKEDDLIINDFSDYTEDELVEANDDIFDEMTDEENTINIDNSTEEDVSIGSNDDKEMDDDMDDAELFDLIDSMYEKRDEK